MRLDRSHFAHSDEAACRTHHDLDPRKDTNGDGTGKQMTRAAGQKISSLLHGNG